MKWVGQDLMKDKISDQMDKMLQKSVQNLFCVLLIKWIPRSLKEPKEEGQTNLRENTMYYMNCNFHNLFHFLNIHAASQNLIYWNVSASIFEANDLWVPSQAMDIKNPEVVIIVDPSIATTPAIGSKGAIEE
uniref:Uncharacterized protein n=1 Tax=Romanomermis culicivorax TaxID=13658 RepID=A0A915J6S3_ROMCU